MSLGWVCVPGCGVGISLGGSVCQGVGLEPSWMGVCASVWDWDPSGCRCPLRGTSALWVLLTHAELLALLLTLAEGCSLCCWFPGG